jgi:hypothetical protein
MSHQINIILAKASWCQHCDNFTPIYELAKEQINSAKQLDNCKITFESYEVDKDDQGREFKAKYPGLIDYLEGYPTVYFRMGELQGGEPNKIKTEFINHTVAKGSDKKELKSAADDFIENIVNKYKSILSGNKELHMNVQKGGMINYMTSLQEVKYRNKYLKYKSKYLELKNN